MSTKSPRERDIGFSQEKPAHEAAPIQREAIANNTERRGTPEVGHRHEGEITHTTIATALDGRTVAK